MGKIFKKCGKNNKGMTFVEILCAVAIMSLVSGIIGSVIVVSTRTYGKGISETNVQQEAQLAANNIGNIVKDAYKVVYGEKGGKYYEDGVETEDLNNHEYTELTLVTGSTSEYSVFYYPNDEEPSKGRLVYAEYEISTDSDGVQSTSETAEGLLAENITKFKAETDGFAETRTITLYITVYDDSTDREIEMTYTMTSRNEAGTGIEYVAVEVPVQIYIDDSVILVPGETYQIPISVYGEALGEPYVDKENTSAELKESADIVTVDGEYYAEVTLGTDAKDSYTLVVAVCKKDGVTIKSARCTVNVRRATGVTVSVSTNTEGTTGGMLEEAGAKYIFSSTVSGTSLSKGFGRDYDTNYKNPQAVTWSWELTLDGTTYLSGSTDNHVDTDDYISLESYTEDAAAPQIVFVAKQAMTSNFKLIVTATSSHADGYNKADSDYDDVLGSEELGSRDTKVTDSAEIILEPNEEGKVELGMKGGLTSEVSFAFKGCSESDTEDNTYYKDGYVYITPDSDEVGGEDGCDAYTFIVYATVGTGENQTMTITVHVSRIDEMSIEVIDNFTDEKKNLMETPTYDFRGRINTDTASYDDMVAATTYLVDESLGTQRSNTLATRITCEMLNEKDKVVYTYQAICIAGIGSNTSTNGSSTIVLEGKAENDYFKVVNIKPARIEYDSNNAPYIKQAPEVDISPSADTDTGIKNNYTLQVTMEMLHPLGTVSGTKYNKTGETYGEASATASVKGTTEITVPASVIIVEPGQGTDVATMSDEEMVIPITANSGVYYMEATLDESDLTSSDTRLSNYSDDGKKNPYLASTGTSSGSRTWYLGLVIGEDEKGDNGLIDVTVTAYNTSKAVLCTLNFQLAIRRVNKVTVKEDSGASASEWNEAGNKVTLTAYPTGYGEDGVEYYAMQTDDDGTARRWETSGHGAYKTPAAMEWRIEIDGTEMALDDCGEYIDPDSIKVKTNESDYESTVTFKLRQELPSGTKIRAYSLHAYGNYDNLGDSIGDKSVKGDTKYNKSGKQYDEVYGEIGLGIIQVSGEWKRGGTVSLYYDLLDEYLTTWSNGTVALDWNPSSIYTWLETHSMYNNNNGNNITDNTGYSFSVGGNSIGGIHSLIEFTGDTTDIRNYTASISTTTSSADGKDWIALSAYSSPYTTSSYYNWWIDLHEISLTSYIGSTWKSADGALAVVEETYEIEDVVFQYTNALPNTIAGGGSDGDSDGEWTDKDGDNTLVVYVTKDDTISGYTSYYKLSEGWEETYEAYTLIPSRYVGVISRNTSATTQDGKRFSDFSVTNTTGDGSSNTLGRSYVTFTFSNVEDHATAGDVVQMIYEFNPFFADSSRNYGTSCGITLAQAEAIDGCEGILEFHFVNANITGSGTLPEVRYCPTYSENAGNGATSKTLTDGSTVNYYYISDKSRFEINSNGTSAKYQTTTDASTGSWPTVGNMTYSDGSWTYSAVNN